MFRITSYNVCYTKLLRTVFPELGPVELDDLVLRAWGQAGRLLVEYLV